MGAALTILYWRVGRRIRQDVLREERSKYGAKIFQAVSAKLVAEFG